MIQRLFPQIIIFLALALMTACGFEQGPATEPQRPVNTVAALDYFEPAETIIPGATSTFPIETGEPDCPGAEINPIGQSIAEEYESTDYEQVMTWFCNGAEFEDIIVALETETQVDVSAGEMLKMIADGFTWDDIWQLVGLTD